MATGKKLYVRVQFSKDIGGVTEGKLEHLLFCIHKESSFVDYECSLGVGFSDFAGQSQTTSGTSMSTGIFYCKTAQVYSSPDESKFKSQPCVMIEIFSNDPLTSEGRRKFNGQIKKLIETNILKPSGLQSPPIRFCIMNFSAEPA